MPNLSESFYPESRFGGFSDHDGTIVFYTRVNALVQPKFTVLDVGCGRGEHAEDAVDYRRRLRCLRGKAARVIGIDPDVAGSSNPTIDEFRRLMPGQPWPIEAGSVDLVLSDSVLEHLSEAEDFFDEARRVLVPGGYLCIRTTNLLGYVGFVSKLLPNKFHAGLLSRLQNGRRAEDVFPTVYQCNTMRSIRREMGSHGFRSAVYGHTADPTYLSFSKLAYAAGVVHQKLAPSSLCLTIFAFGQLAA
jgi:SAM-dependent methyltransferase